MTTSGSFEEWWEKHGQFCRAGGGDYEKTFAFRAWEAASSAPPAPAEPSVILSSGDTPPEADRLMRMLVAAFGPKHPSVDDLAVLILRAARKEAGNAE